MFMVEMRSSLSLNPLACHKIRQRDEFKFNEFVIKVIIEYIDAFHE